MFEKTGKALSILLIKTVFNRLSD